MRELNAIQCQTVVGVYSGDDDYVASGSGSGSGSGSMSRDPWEDYGDKGGAKGQKGAPPKPDSPASGASDGLAEVIGNLKSALPKGEGSLDCDVSNKTGKTGYDCHIHVDITVNK